MPYITLPYSLSAMNVFKLLLLSYFFLSYCANKYCVHVCQVYIFSDVWGLLEQRSLIIFHDTFCSVSVICACEGIATMRL